MIVKEIFQEWPTVVMDHMKPDHHTGHHKSQGNKPSFELLRQNEQGSDPKQRRNFFEIHDPVRKILPDESMFV